ncbi:S1C family serine protease [Blastochloris viridis]|uniref:Periplasmic serine endoprotease n=1 Tax=Blastochloris viridis TaxID=1079 RepID=A0A0H5BCT1_BLAVI|nr:S1C family serine protease [Blastochloris viridis]ALK10075.1 putative periplasmic serine endoprotease DegP-like precursor [Blastochloris viridis]BAS00001.1 periplasmic serine endoprotease [Blastochloris viridis]CUU42739.1 putative periplasmic serine endoprotease DegP-like precursor [Blastochloris viridis]
MTQIENWAVAADLQPRPGDWRFDLDHVFDAVVGLSTTVPADAFTAPVLGTERAGHGVVIREGVVLTVGYLITEADTVWIACRDGRLIQGDPIGYDHETGFGLVQALGRLDLPVLPMGHSKSVAVGGAALVAASGGRSRSLAARVIAKQEFAGYWEYLLDEALFTAPAHPFWGGTALIAPSGELIGIGSLHLERALRGGGSEPINMMVPIELLPPILGDLLAFGRPQRPPRPWLGMLASDLDDSLTVIGLVERGPAVQAGLQIGDVVLAVGEVATTDLAELFREIWALGPAGVEVPLRLWREGRVIEARVHSAARDAFLRRPRLH